MRTLAVLSVIAATVLAGCAATRPQTRTPDALRLALLDLSAEPGCRTARQTLASAAAALRAQGADLAVVRGASADAAGALLGRSAVVLDIDGPAQEAEPCSDAGQDRLVLAFRSGLLRAWPVASPGVTPYVLQNLDVRTFAVVRCGRTCPPFDPREDGALIVILRGRSAPSEPDWVFPRVQGARLRMYPGHEPISCTSGALQVVMRGRAYDAFQGARTFQAGAAC